MMQFMSELNCNGCIKNSRILSISGVSQPRYNGPGPGSVFSQPSLKPTTSLSGAVAAAGTTILAVVVSVVIIFVFCISACGITLWWYYNKKQKDIKDNAFKVWNEVYGDKEHSSQHKQINPMVIGGEHGRQTFMQSVRPSMVHGSPAGRESHMVRDSSIYSPETSGHLQSPSGTTDVNFEAVNPAFGTVKRASTILIPKKEEARGSESDVRFDQAHADNTEETSGENILLNPSVRMQFKAGARSSMTPSSMTGSPPSVGDDITDAYESRESHVISGEQDSRRRAELAHKSRKSLKKALRGSTTSSLPPPPPPPPSSGGPFDEE